MKNIKRLAFSLISTCLLAAGLVRAADKLDPISRDLRGNQQEAIGSAVDCTNLCHIAEDIK